MKHQIIDPKLSSGGNKGEADECLFEYLHAEMVNYVLSSPVKATEVSNRAQNFLSKEMRKEAARELGAFARDNKKYMDEQCRPSEKEEDLSRLECMGFSVGYRIIERLTREWPRFKDELDTIKFICTDFWSSLYQKQIDNLRTNHHGTYMLQDNSFRLLANIGGTGSKQYLRESPRLLAFTCGLLRGSLANLGIPCTVDAEVSALPSCKFNVNVQSI